MHLYNTQVTPFFSIITVCLNAGNELKKTIDSILHQSFFNYEIIIKDGGSRDASLNELPENKKINLIIKNDQGIYDAMNQALESARGQYVLFLNAGDYFFDNSVLKAFYEIIIRSNYPSVIYCNYMSSKQNIYIQSPVRLTRFFLFRTMLCHQVCMIKREMYYKYGNFNTNYKVDADFDFLLRLIIIGKESYKYLKKIGIYSTHGGFSIQNKSLGKNEVKNIRKLYFPKQYLFYSIFYLMTFPGLRDKIASGNGLLSKLYLKIVNLYNRLI